MAEWQRLKKGPNPIKVAGRVFYRLDDLVKFVGGGPIQAANAKPASPAMPPNRVRQAITGNSPIDCLEISVRSYHCLRVGGYSTVSEVVAASDDELMRIPNMGKRSLAEIRDVIFEGLERAA